MCLAMSTQPSSGVGAKSWLPGLLRRKRLPGARVELRCRLTRWLLRVHHWLPHHRHSTHHWVAHHHHTHSAGHTTDCSGGFFHFAQDLARVFHVQEVHLATQPLSHTALGGYKTALQVAAEHYGTCVFVYYAVDKSDADETALQLVELKEPIVARKNPALDDNSVGGVAIPTVFVPQVSSNPVPQDR